MPVLTVEEDMGQYDDNIEVFWATGAALFIRSSCWKEIGGLDADFFAHMEEIDLCWRLKRHGYRVMYCGQSTVYHLGGGTLNAESPYKTYLNFRNNLVMLQKNMGIIQSVVVIFIRLWLDFITLFKFLAESKPANARSINKAHTNFFRNLRKTHKKRLPITRFNAKGLYSGSIVWQYFVAGKKKFSSLF
jgi:GT2 family glycosyltransferase